MSIGNALQSNGVNDGLIVDLDFQHQLAIDKLRIWDAGDILFLQSREHYRDIGHRQEFICKRASVMGAYPIVLGGDHSISFHSAKALSEVYGEIGIIQFDAHGDMYTSIDDLSGINHANVFSHIADLAAVRTIWQIGLRDAYFQRTVQTTQIDDPKVKILTARELECDGANRRAIAETCVRGRMNQAALSC